MQSIGKIIKRVLLGLLLLIGAVVVIIGGLIVFEGATSPSSVENSNVSYTDSAGNPLHGYLARPEGEGPFPAVLMIHEWWGLTAEIPELAEALAAEGYIVLAPDAYRGEVTDQVPRALFLRLTTPQEQISADLDAAFEYLLAVDGVDPGRVASLGYCFGGEQSLLLGLRQADRLAAMVMYYGSMVTEEARLRPLIGTPVLGIFGAEDQQIPVGEVRAFEAALEDLQIEHQITIYPGVGHAFVTAENYDEPGAAGDAWQETLTFLGEQLAPPAE